LSGFNAESEAWLGNSLRVELLVSGPDGLGQEDSPSVGSVSHPPRDSGQSGNERRVKGVVQENSEIEALRSQLPRQAEPSPEAGVTPLPVIDMNCIDRFVVGKELRHERGCKNRFPPRERLRMAEAGVVMNPSRAIHRPDENGTYSRCFESRFAAGHYSFFPDSPIFSASSASMTGMPSRTG